jgi:hypothetical protein
MMSTRSSGVLNLLAPVLLAAACSVTGGCQGSVNTTQPQYAPGYGPYPPGYAQPGHP